MKEEKEIIFSKNVKLPSMKHCCDIWDTAQTEIVVPTKEINSKKHREEYPMMNIVIATSIMSAKEGIITSDKSGKGSIIMNTCKFNSLCENLTSATSVKCSKITKTLAKVLDQKSKEFQYVTLLNSNDKESQYYKIDYSDGFVLVDLRILHYMLTHYNYNMIRVYLIMLWRCREGWTYVTQENVAEDLGLTKNSRRQAGKILNKLVADGFLRRETGYREIIKEDKTTGKQILEKYPYSKYKIKTIEEALREETPN